MTLKGEPSEKRDLQSVLGLRDDYRKQAKVVLSRLGRIGRCQRGATVVDIGAAQGMFVLACTELGYKGIGVEPFPAARQLAQEIAEITGTALQIIDGTAESIPLMSNSADVVHARSVVEHVVDIDRTFAEAFRVLRSGGIFWFGTASSMCPMQAEIRGFPAFGWYPDSLKRLIMRWCSEHRPQLIGHGIPAMHWFTPRKAHRLLKNAGFGKVYDRWDLRLPEEGGIVYKTGLRAIQKLPAGKFVADVVVPGCSYAAVKP